MHREQQIDAQCLDKRLAEIGSKEMSTPRGSIRSIRDTEVQIGTGMGWEGWLARLDEADARNMRLTEITDYLVEVYKIERVWAQVIAVYYKWGV